MTVIDFGAGGVAALQQLARLPRRPAGPVDPAAVQEAEDRIRDDFAGYGYAYDNQDLDAVVDCFAEDCVISAPRGPMRGSADVREHYRAAFAAGTTRHIWSNVIVRVLDPAAEAYLGAYHHTLLLREEHQCVTGTDIRHLRRIDGDWKIAGRWLTIDTAYSLAGAG
jgi:ketosteroid isomerase-like protein